MNTATLTPAAGLIAPNLDPRHCVSKPAQWWDTGNEHNARAVRYCRTCPLLKQCAADTTDKPKGQIRAAVPYNAHGKRISVCRGCDRPRMRVGKAGNITCGCPRKLSREEAAAQRRAEREAAQAAKLAARARQQKPTGMELVDLWVPLHCAGLDIKQAAQRIGVRHGTLKNVLHRARAAGDRRVPHFRAPRKTEAVAA